jgi:hypothetical protein
MERTVMRLVLVAGLATAGALWYTARRADEKVAASMSGLIGVAVVGGVNGFSRAQARRRWEAAWDAYATAEA